MVLTSRYWMLALFVAPMSNALPFNGLLPRTKKPYSVVNVDGGLIDLPKATTTILEEKTRTVTPKVTTTSTPTPTPTPAPPRKNRPRPSPKSTSTPTPSVVYVTVTETKSPTKFYDNGMWHTSYAVKTFPGDVYLMTPSSGSSETPSPTSS